MNLTYTIKPNKKLPDYFIRRDNEYIYEFPCYKYQSQSRQIPTITCRMTVDLDERKLFISVYDSNLNTLYTPYFKREGNNRVVDKIDSRIKYELTKLAKENVISLD